MGLLALPSQPAVLYPLEHGTSGRVGSIAWRSSGSLAAGAVTIRVLLADVSPRITRGSRGRRPGRHTAGGAGRPEGW